MTLHDVAIQAAVHLHGTLYVDFIAHTELTQVAALQRLAHGRHGILSVPDAHHGEAHPIVGHALVDSQLVHETALQGEMHVVQLMLNGRYHSRFFYDT